MSRAFPKQFNRSCSVRSVKGALMEWRRCWLGRGGPSEPRSRVAARSCAGLDGDGAHRAIMTCAIIGLPQTAAALRKLVPSASIRCMMTASLRASATLAFFIPLRLPIFIAQLFNAVQPLSGLVRMMWALS